MMAGLAVAATIWLPTVLMLTVLSWVALNWSVLEMLPIVPAVCVIERRPPQFR